MENRAAQQIGIPTPEQQQQHDLATSQALRNYQIVQERNAQGLRREIETARERERLFLAAREQQREQEQAEMAQLQADNWKRETIEAWVAANLPLADFDKNWPALLAQKQLAEMEAQQLRLRQLPASSAF